MVRDYGNQVSGKTYEVTKDLAELSIPHDYRSTSTNMKIHE